jgi:hypothetical protein
MRFLFFSYFKEVTPMHLAENRETETDEDLTKQIVDQTLAVAIGYQEAFRSFTKARIAFYGACMLIGLNMAQTSLAPFVGEKE